MSTIFSGAAFSATATQSGNQRKIDRTSNGVLWAIAGSPGASNAYQVAYSTDQGTTWTPQGVLGTGGTAYAPSASLFIDVDDYAHAVWKQQTTGQLYYTRGTPNAGRTAYTWSSAVAVVGNANTDVPDVVAHREGTGWVAHVVYSYSTQNTAKAVYRKVVVTAAGAITVDASDTILSTGANNTVMGYPSIDFNHTGDGKTVAGGTPHLYLGWSAGATGAGFGIRFRKATYAGGAWTWGTEREIDNTRYIADGSSYWLTTAFDGTRVQIAGFLADTSSGNDLVLHERDAADTTTTTRVLLDNAAAADRLHGGSATYSPTGDAYFAGIALTGATGTRTLNWRKWTRSTATLGAVTAVDTTANDAPYVSMRRAAVGRLDFVYTDGTASPYTVAYGGVALNTAPNAPTLTAPASGSTVDRAATNRLQWVFSDPDAGDSQSKFDLQYRTGTGAWTTVTQSTPLTYWDAPGGTFGAGSWEWQARTYDAQGVVGPWSASGFFTAATAPAAPTITAPVNGAGVPTPSALLTWSAPGQDAYQVRRVADTAGTANTGTVYSDTGTVVDATARSRTVGFDVNNRTEHVQLRVRSAGLWSPWADVRVTVAYTPPATPVVTLAPDDTTGSLLVTITNPAPTGTQPVVVTADVLVDDGKGLERRATGVTGATWRYFTPVGGRNYQGNVVVAVFAANGTTATGLAT